jgi:hypothetical protein
MGASISGVAHVSITEDRASKAVEQGEARDTRSEAESAGQDPESAREILSGNTMFLLAVAVVVLLGIFALLIAI